MFAFAADAAIYRLRATRFVAAPRSPVSTHADINIGRLHARLLNSI